MGKIEWLVCSAFIEKKAKAMRSSLLSFLSSKEKKEFSELPPPSLALCDGFDLDVYLINQVHHTWFTPFLRSLPKQDISLFLSVFNDSQTEELKKNLLFSEPVPTISSVSKTFLQKKLIEALLIDNKDLCPPEALKNSPLNILLSLNTKELTLLTDFLGLHDLSIEIRQIIDTTKIKKIHLALPKEKLFFLEILSTKKEPVIFKQMELHNWDGNAETLLQAVRKRGMNRLAKALVPEDENLIFYIKHRMSVEDAVLFSALHKKLEQTKAYSFLSSQIIETISFLKKYKILVHV